MGKQEIYSDSAKLVNSVLLVGEYISRTSRSRKVIIEEILNILPHGSNIRTHSAYLTIGKC